MKGKKMETKTIPSKVLVFGMTPNPGGVESVLMNYYRNINNKKVHFDFLCNSYDKIAYEDELVANGSKIFKVAMRSKHSIKYHKELNEFFEKNASNYDAIWVNLNSLANIDYLKLAKKYGIKRRIIHSHNSRNMDGYLRGLLHEKNKKQIARYATDFWACSVEAGKWFYPEKIRKYEKIINNAIDLNSIRFDEEQRKILRKKFNLEGKLVIGNVGRLHFQKNQTFLLEIAKELKNIIPNIKVVLVGDGEDKEKLKKKSQELGIEEDVLFTGVQKNIASWLSAFDIFVFPSLFEGLGLALIEAEATGLTTIASKSVIPKEVAINSNFTFFPLNTSSKEWTEKIIKISKSQSRLTEKEVLDNFKSAGFNIAKESKKLEKIFYNN